MKYYFSLLYPILRPYVLVFLLIQLVTRCLLLCYSMIEIDYQWLDVIGLWFLGTYFDIITSCFVLLPIVLIWVLTPSSMFSRIDPGLRYLSYCVWVFTAFAEIVFWMEFHTRFNFIAVDYLVYTQEVIGNIVQSYPIGWLLLTVLSIGAALTWGSLRLFPSRIAPCVAALPQRAVGLSMVVCSAIVAYVISNVEQSHITHNAEANELASNGIYQLFYAYSNNEISYDSFYQTHDTLEVAKQIRELLHEEDMDITFASNDVTDITRVVHSSRPEQHKNVIIVVMESMSANYMTRFGNSAGITPNLDRMAEEGLFFSNAYATGTRTVRGLEAVALSLPPTPGQSIIRRADNAHLFSLGYIFKDRGYDTRFIYGGYGYFDNMNAFFSGNGFDVVDRTDFAKQEVEFENVWGVSDEDLFKQVMKQADTSYNASRPFMHIVMTTSNHRPYTFPAGRIDIEPKNGGRYAGVKYADYSIGKFIEWSKEKPWFKDTIFVFVADHTAGASGKVELDPKKYHIPMLFYSPAHIPPKTYDKIASQIDLAPVLLGQLHFNYLTKFYGEDVIHDTDEVPHAFISNYQKIGLFKDNDLSILIPKKLMEHYAMVDGVVDENTSTAGKKQDTDEVIAYYQSASLWRKLFQRVPSTLVHKGE